MHQGTCLRTSSTAPPHMHHLRCLHYSEQTGESLGARTPCECSPRSLRLAARKPNLTPTSPHICGIRESFQRHILPPAMPCCLASSFSLSAASITRRIHCLTCSGLPPTGPVVASRLPSVTPHSGVVACSLNRLGSLVSVLSFSMSTQRIPSLRGHTCSALAHKTMPCLLTL